MEWGTIGWDGMGRVGMGWDGKIWDGYIPWDMSFLSKRMERVLFGGIYFFTGRCWGRRGNTRSELFIDGKRWNTEGNIFQAGRDAKM